MKFPGFDLWRASRDKQAELKKKYVSERPVASERDEGMIARATERADAENFMRLRRPELLRELKEKYDIMDLKESDLEEVYNINDLMDGVLNRLRAADAALSEQESLAEQMSKWGSGLDPETRARINTLENYKKQLAKMYGELGENLKGAYREITRTGESFAAKPKGYDELIGSDLVAVESPRPLADSMETKRADLAMREAAEEIEGKLSESIDELNAQSALKKLSSKTGLVLEAIDFEETKRPVIRELMNDSFEELRDIHDKIRSIKLKTGMAEEGPEAMAA